MDFDTACPMVLRSLGSGAPLRVSPAFENRMELDLDAIGEKRLAEWLHPDDRRAVEQLIEAREGVAVARHATGSGVWVPFEWRVREHDGDLIALGRERSCTSPPSDLAREHLPEHQSMAATLTAMALIVEGKNEGMRCSILLIDHEHDRVTVGAGPSLPAEYNAAVEGLQIGPTVGSCGTAAYWNVPVVVEDIARDPLWKGLRDAATIAGVAACWSQPITTTGGVVLGAMALYNDEPRAPTRHQMDGLETAARMVGLAIERNRLEEALRRADKMKALGILAGGIAHDFNNLLSAVLGNAELAMDLLPGDTPARGRLEDIVRASKSATDLCSQMLAYAGRGALSPETLELNALVNEISALLRVAIPKKATLVQRLHADDIGVLADRGQLRQVILNLINNAAEAIGESAGRIVVSTDVVSSSDDGLRRRYPRAALPAREYVRLRVSDTGIGMTPDTQKEIFDPFFTTKPAGSGLGLAAVQGIVQRHRGALSVESKPGVGTTFEVLLPRVPVRAAIEDVPSTAQAVPGGTWVLVVDDEPLVLGIHGDILEAGGYSVVRAKEGRQAIEIFRDRSASIACVLLDYSMPGMNGEQVFETLRAICPDVRVVLTSGFTESEFRLRLQSAGFAGFVPKPATVEILLRVIADAAGTPKGDPA